MLCTLCVGQASALEYTMEAPDDYLFGRPTSDDTIYEWEDPNVDRSKNTALIPPGFGTPTSYLPGSSDPLTPNLIPGALDGGGLVSQTGSVNYPVIDTGNGDSSGQDVGYTAVTSDLYYSGGHLGTLKIPDIGLSTKVYEGTDSSTLAKGAGHFPGTSIWDGNCCIAGHNRGVRDDFGDLHTLEPGDTITWTTKLGTRTYQVVSVEKVLETDTSDTASTTDNRITLFTCVRDQQEYRWCVRAVELYLPASGAWDRRDRLGMHPGRVSLCPGRFFHLQRHDPGTLFHGLYPLRISHAQTALIPNGGSLCQTYGTHINKGGHPT